MASNEVVNIGIDVQSLKTNFYGLQTLSQVGSRFPPRFLDLIKFTRGSTTFTSPSKVLVKIPTTFKQNKIKINKINM